MSTDSYTAFAAALLSQYANEMQQKRGTDATAGVGRFVSWIMRRGRSALFAAVQPINRRRMARP